MDNYIRYLVNKASEYVVSGRSGTFQIHYPEGLTRINEIEILPLTSKEIIRDEEGYYIKELFPPEVSLYMYPYFISEVKDNPQKIIETIKHRILLNLYSGLNERITYREKTKLSFRKQKGKEKLILTYKHSTIEGTISINGRNVVFNLFPNQDINKFFWGLSDCYPSNSLYM